eukprot:940941-Rhodomonas_salina.4
MAAIEVDVEAGTHSHAQMEEQISESEASRAGGFVVKPDPDVQITNPYSEQTAPAAVSEHAFQQQPPQFPNTNFSQPWTSSGHLAPSAATEARSSTPKGVRKRPPPPINFGGQFGQFAPYDGDPAHKKQCE